VKLIEKNNNKNKEKKSIKLIIELKKLEIKGK
jgi:hypothetical protein